MGSCRRHILRTLLGSGVVSLCPRAHASATARVNSVAPAPESDERCVWAAGARIAAVADPLLVYCIALVETGSCGTDGRIRPQPWAIRFPRGPVFPTSEADAAQYLSNLPDDADVDIGMMQVNWAGAVKQEFVASPQELLKPWPNVLVASSILKDALDSAPTDLILGVGRYHSWRDAEATAYGRMVFDLYESVAGRPGWGSSSWVF